MIIILDCLQTLNPNLATPVPEMNLKAERPEQPLFSPPLLPHRLLRLHHPPHPGEQDCKARGMSPKKAVSLMTSLVTIRKGMLGIRVKLVLPGSASGLGNLILSICNEPELCSALTPRWQGLAKGRRMSQLGRASCLPKWCDLILCSLSGCPCMLLLC